MFLDQSWNREGQGALYLDETAMAATFGRRINGCDTGMLVEQSSGPTNTPSMILDYVSEEYTPISQTVLVANDQEMDSPSPMDIDAETTPARRYSGQANPSHLKDTSEKSHCSGVDF